MSVTAQPIGNCSRVALVGRKLGRRLATPDFWVGIVAILVTVILWEVGCRSRQWFGFGFQALSVIPAPDHIFTTWSHMVLTEAYWQSVMLSTVRVATGFVAAMIIGIPFGLWLALSRIAYGVFFPPFEVLRPIPPIAWVPASIIFWPTQDLSIAFVIFLGAFFTVVINVLGGARSIDVRYVQAALSMGSSRLDIFRRVVLPAVLPSIIVGAVVGMGITWEVVIAAELISGGGSSANGAGLGFFIWNAYVSAGPAGLTDIIIGMLSIGAAGYLSSAAIRRLGVFLTPWLIER